MFPPHFNTKLAGFGVESSAGSIESVLAMPGANLVPLLGRRSSFDDGQPMKSPRNQQLLRGRRNSWSSGDPALLSPGGESKSPKHRLKVQVCVRLRPEIAELDAGPDLRTPAPGATPPPSPQDPQREVAERPWLDVSSVGGKAGKAGEPGRSNCLAYKGNRFKFKHVFAPTSTQLEVYEAAHAPQVTPALAL